MTVMNDPILEIGRLAQELTGVQFSERHREMIKSRLLKRMGELKISSFETYLNYYRANLSAETPKLVALLTTHHTYFFREFSHFEFLLSTGLPALLANVRARPDRTLRVWSAACSRGQEAYSLAMFLELHLKLLDPTIKYEILGTDIDEESVTIAKNGVYRFDELKEVPLSLMGKNWIRGTGEISEYAKASSALRKNCVFRSANLFDLGAAQLPVKKFDIIFCRNVFIYFNQEQIKKVALNLLERLDQDGFMFIGISESLLQLGLSITSGGPSVYQHKSKTALKSSVTQGARLVAETKQVTLAAVTQRRLIRVLCVDDSPVILTLLASVFTEKLGFEIVGTAANGLIAAEKVKELKPDVMTLDVHMPEQTGVEYLEKNFKPGHIPVVMVTSVTRQTSDLAGRALELGASDYVEKPALSNLSQVSEELRTKIRCAVMASGLAQKPKLNLDKSFQRQVKIDDAGSKLRVVIMTLAHRHQLKSLFREFTGTQPGCVLSVDGAKETLEAMVPTLSRDIGVKIQFSETIPKNIGVGEIWLLDLTTHISDLWQKYGQLRRTSILVYGDVTKATAQKLAQFQGAQLILEDLGAGRGTEPLMEIANDVVLPTSFAYLSNEFFSKAEKAA